MADLVFVLLIIVFFGAAAGLVRFCDRVIGPGEAVGRQPKAEPTPEKELAA